MAQTLNDSIQASLLYSQLDLRGVTNTKDGLFLHDGVAALQNHVVNEPFRRDEARVAAGKAACVAAWIQGRPAGVTISQMRFPSAKVGELRQMRIEPPWAVLNRLKGGNPQAFHYWYHAQRILRA
jgi:hypothetical protein